MYVRIYVCMFVYTYVCLYLCTYLCKKLHACMHAYILVYMKFRTNASIKRIKQYVTYVTHPTPGVSRIDAHMFVFGIPK